MEAHEKTCILIKLQLVRYSRHIIFEMKFPALALQTLKKYAKNRLRKPKLSVVEKSKNSHQ